MDNEFIGPRELAQAGVGIGLAVILIVFLQIYRRSRERRAGEERLEELAARGTDAPAGTVPFFIANFDGSYARFFRVYVSAPELLFVYAGQFFFLIDDDSPRATDQRHWLLRSLKLVCAGLGAVVVLGGFVLAAMLRGVMRSATDNPGGAIDILTIVCGIIAFCAAIVVIGIPITLWGITRRCRQLDQMSLSQLRREAELHSKSVRVSTDTVTDLKLKRYDTNRDLLPSSQVACVLSFKHITSGRWTINIRSTRDTRDALEACLTIWGHDRVEIDPQLLDLRRV